MANETEITITGNLTEKPELNQVGNSVVCNLTVASTPSTYDRESGQFKDKETIFLRGAVWRDQARNLVASLDKGDRVMVKGNLRSNSYEDKETGGKRVSLQMDIIEIGASLMFATVQVTKTSKGGGAAASAPAATQAPAKDDTDGWGNDAGDDEPPF